RRHRAVLTHGQISTVLWAHMTIAWRHVPWYYTVRPTAANTLLPLNAPTPYHTTPTLHQTVNTVQGRTTGHQSTESSCSCSRTSMPDKKWFLSTQRHTCLRAPSRYASELLCAASSPRRC
ncbi:unnamed protein product, partial [Sphacelaria rigidula]